MDYSSDISKKIKDNIVSTLIILDNEAHDPNITANEYGKRGMAIKYLLENIENHYGTDFMVGAIAVASKQLGHSLGPLDVEIVKKLIPYGVTIGKVRKVVSYKK